MSEFRVVLHTALFDESVEFYIEALGWTYVRGWDDDGMRGCIIAAGESDAIGARIELLEANLPAEPSGVFVSVEVPDVEAAHARLVAADAPVTQPVAVQPWGHRNTATVDPNGLTVVLFTVV